MTKLCPSQQKALDLLTQAFTIGDLIVLYGGVGLGKTTVLRELHRRVGGAFLDMKNLVDAMRVVHPLALEETFGRMVSEALASYDHVFVDDLHLLNNVVCCNHFYPRMGYFNASATSLAAAAAESGKKLVFASETSPPGPIYQRAFGAAIDEFKAVDYEAICREYLDTEAADKLDYAKILRFAAKLNAHQLKGACKWLKADETLDTERFIEYLRSQRLASNVDLDEVPDVDLHDLKGVDDIIRSLEANIILPLENDELAVELALKPKRGVLLAGPPGTGKTTVGRALARRLRSKFFLIDGTFISGTGNFYGQVHHIFEAAKQNAPSIIFIDDSDAIFESGEELGLYRYLLTILDGLESASAGRVCVMLTAMDVGNLPPALIRSGRIELWLEMRLPDAEARASILNSHLSQLPAALAGADVTKLLEATDGFTGADLKRLIEDGKTLYAYDRAQQVDLRPSTEYFLSAVESVRANKERYAEAEARARKQRPARPVWYDVAGGSGSFSEGFTFSE